MSNMSPLELMGYLAQRFREAVDRLIAEDRVLRGQFMAASGPEGIAIMMAASTQHFSAPQQSGQEEDVMEVMGAADGQLFSGMRSLVEDMPARSELSLANL